MMKKKRIFFKREIHRIRHECCTSIVWSVDPELKDENSFHINTRSTKKNNVNIQKDICPQNIKDWNLIHTHTWPRDTLYFWAVRRKSPEDSFVIFYRVKGWGFIHTLLTKGFANVDFMSWILIQNIFILISFHVTGIVFLYILGYRGYVIISSLHPSILI